MLIWLWRGSTVHYSTRLLSYTERTQVHKGTAQIPWELVEERLTRDSLRARRIGDGMAIWERLWQMGRFNEGGTSFISWFNCIRASVVRSFLRLRRPST